MGSPGRLCWIVTSSLWIMTCASLLRVSGEDMSKNRQDNVTKCRGLNIIYKALGYWKEFL